MIKSGWRALVTVVAGAAVAGGAAPGWGQVTLTNDTVSAGLSATHMPDADGIPGPQEWMTGGLGVGDFNRDGCMDIFWVGGGGVADKLFINDCDGSGHFTDQAASWGLTELHCGNAVAVGDYDDDDWPDVFVTSFGVPGRNGSSAGSHRLYHNDAGSGFTEVAAIAGVDQSCALPVPVVNPAGYGAAFGDYDVDGLLDLLVTSWWADDEGTRLYHNNGDGTFDDVTVTALGAAVDGVWGFQPAFVDTDGDRFPELLIAADFKSSRYFVNEADGTFTNDTVASGTGLDDNGMGQAVADFDNDGLFDWYVTSIHKDNPQPGDNIGNMLYMAQGTHVFLESSIATGTNDGGWGWGTLAIDLDQDTWMDIVEVNGRTDTCGPGGGEWACEFGKLFYNNGDDPLTFDEIAAASGFDHDGQGRAMAYLDVEPDGDLDFLVATNEGTLSFYRNDTAGGNALRIRFDTSNNPRLAADGFGTRVIATITTSETKDYVRYVSSAPSYLSTSEPSVHFGLGAAETVDVLRIEWSFGYVTVMNDVPAAGDMVISSPTWGDINVNGTVGIGDFLTVLGNWGPCPDAPEPCLADLDNDGQVGIGDFLIVLGLWG